MHYLISMFCIATLAVWGVSGRSVRHARSAGSASSRASSNTGTGVISVATSNSGGGVSSANAGIGAGPGSGRVTGSMQASVSGPQSGTISSNSGPVILTSGQDASLGLSTGGNMGSTGGNMGSIGNPIDAGGIIGTGFQSPQQMLCNLRINICEQCLRINQLTRVIAKNSGSSSSFTDMSCPGFCGTTPC